MIPYRRVQTKNKATSYCIRSFVMVREPVASARGLIQQIQFAYLVTFSKSSIILPITVVTTQPKPKRPFLNTQIIKNGTTVDKRANTFANHRTPYTYETNNIRAVVLVRSTSRSLPFAFLVVHSDPRRIDLLVQPSFQPSSSCSCLLTASETEPRPRGSLPRERARERG